MSVLSVKNVRFDMAGSITGITALQQQPLDVLEGRQAQIVKYQKKLQRLLVRGGSHFFSRLCATTL